MFGGGWGGPAANSRDVSGPVIGGRGQWSVACGAFPYEVSIQSKHAKCFAGLGTELVCLNDLEGEVARAAAFTGFKGDLTYRLDWWTGIG